MVIPKRWAGIGADWLEDRATTLEQAAKKAAMSYRSSSGIRAAMDEVARSYRRAAGVLRIDAAALRSKAEQ